MSRSGHADLIRATYEDGLTIGEKRTRRVVVTVEARQTFEFALEEGVDVKALCEDLERRAFVSLVRHPGPSYGRPEPTGTYACVQTGFSAPTVDVDASWCGTCGVATDAPGDCAECVQWWLDNPQGTKP